MDGPPALDGETGGDASAFSGDHVICLHAEGGVGNGGGRNGSGNEQIRTLLLTREEGPIGNLPRFNGHAEIAFREHLVHYVREVVDLVSQPLDLADIDVVASHADRVIFLSKLLKVVLGKEVFAEHAATFPDIKLKRPMAGVCELVLRETPAARFDSDRFGDSRIIRQKVE